MRPLGVAPFLLPALHDVWPAHAEFLQETFKMPHIYCLLPRFELWSRKKGSGTNCAKHPKGRSRQLVPDPLSSQTLPRLDRRRLARPLLQIPNRKLQIPNEEGLSGQFTGIPGQVLWALGTHHINQMPTIGLPAPEFLESAK